MPRQPMKVTLARHPENATSSPKSEYMVISADGTTNPKVGDWMSEDQVRALDNRNVKYHIVMAKK